MEGFVRTATFIPESKRLKILLKEFRKSRNHIAIVVDEYGRTAGLLTIEDVLEQIVGDIEDEYDAEDVPMIKEVGHKLYIVDALVRIEDFNDFFGTEFLDEDYDTLGGLLIKTLGRLPKQEEIIDLKTIKFRILQADNRRLQSIEVKKID
jgi:magnesium and cobalt transporter